MDRIIRWLIVNLIASVIYLYINRKDFKKDRESTIRSLFKNCLLPLNIFMIIGMMDFGSGGGSLPDEDYYMSRRGR
jgi:hypothetical protein